jgi:hypothetical protein
MLFTGGGEAKQTDLRRKHISENAFTLFNKSAALKM